MFKAILWDNDGVLVDTEGLYRDASREILATFGIDLTEEAYIEHFLNRATGMRSLLESLGRPENPESIRAKRNELYTQVILARNTIIEGVAETLPKLAPHFRMGVVTGSRRDHFDILHRRTGILHHFEFVLSVEDYPHEKPHPAPYLSGIARMGLHPSECLAIEDSERGLASAKAAGLTCWVIPSGLTRHCRLEAADRRLQSISELPHLLGCAVRT